MEKTVSAPLPPVKRRTFRYGEEARPLPLYRISWRGLYLQVRCSHAEVLALLRLLRSEGQGVVIC